MTDLTQLIWGFVLFRANSLIYNELNKKSNYRHVQNERIGRRSANQYVGIGDEIITIPGKLAPIVTGGRNELQLLKFQADMGLPLPLIEGNGVVHGFFVLTELEENSRYHLANGSPRIIDYTVTLKRVGDDHLDYSQISQGMARLLG